MNVYASLAFDSAGERSFKCPFSAEPYRPIYFLALGVQFATIAMVLRLNRQHIARSEGPRTIAAE